MTELAPIQEEELHAFVDNLLEPDRREAVRRYLSEQPDAAAMVADFQAQRDALRSIFAPIAAAPVPPALNLSRLIEERLPARRNTFWRQAASIVLALGIGGGGGWLLHANTDGNSPTGMAALAREAVSSHLVYASDKRRPVELWAPQRDDLARWLSNRLNRPVAPPDLTELGYKLIGGRLVATDRGPAALFMYDNEAGLRMTMFVRPVMAQTTGIHRVDVRDKDTDGFAWVEKGIGYMMMGPEDKLLERMAVHVKRQLDQAS